MLALTLVVLSTRPNDAWGAFKKEPQHPYGFFVGPALSNASFDLNGSPSNRSGRTALHIGIWTEFPIAASLFFRPELTYAPRGSRTSEGSLSQLNYLEIPLLLEAKLSSNSTSFIFPLGLSGALLIAGNTVDSDGAIRKINPSSVASFDLSLVAGAGLGFKVEEHWELSFFVRYVHGLTNVARFQSQGRSAHYFSRTVSLCLGLFFDESGLVLPHVGVPKITTE